MLGIVIQLGHQRLRGWNPSGLDESPANYLSLSESLPRSEPNPSMVKVIYQEKTQVSKASRKLQQTNTDDNHGWPNRLRRPKLLQGAYLYRPHGQIDSRGDRGRGLWKQGPIPEDVGNRTPQTRDSFKITFASRWRKDIFKVASTTRWGKNIFKIVYLAKWGRDICN